MSTLFSLAEDIRRCTACPLYKERLLPVPGEGPANAKVMIIGEAPGAQEDRTGQPFVGRSGKVLDEMLTVAGLTRDDVFITGSCKCHPPKNRNPTVKELKACKENWLLKQIELINPRLIVLIGKVAIDNFFSGKILKKDHGKIIERDGRDYFLTYHPAAAMRFPTIRTLMKKDFETLANFVKKI